MIVVKARVENEEPEYSEHSNENLTLDGCDTHSPLVTVMICIG